MPHSSYEGKEWAADIFAVVKPKLVLDIGPGAGTWHDVLSPRHRTFWLGVEIWEPYIAAYGLLEKYNRVIVSDVRTYLESVTHSITKPELVIFGDVLEHMPQEDAEMCLQKTATTQSHILVSVPINHYEQGEMEGNPHEAHLWYPTHEWAMDFLKPDAHTRGDIVGTYWSAP